MDDVGAWKALQSVAPPDTGNHSTLSDILTTRYRIICHQHLRTSNDGDRAAILNVRFMQVLILFGTTSGSCSREIYISQYSLDGGAIHTEKHPTIADQATDSIALASRYQLVGD